MAESFWQKMGRNVFGVDDARQQDDYGGLALEKVARNNPSKISELAKEDKANTEKNEKWQKAAVIGASALGGFAGSQAMEGAGTTAAPVDMSPFLNAYISARKSALKTQIGE